MATKVSYGVANIASHAEAEAGTAVDKFMTPERAAQALVAQAPASAQIMTFNGDSSVTITPNVVDGMYRITGVLVGTADREIYLQTSDDDGATYSDTSGDTYAWLWYQRAAITSVSATNINTDPGHRLTTANGGAAGSLEAAYFDTTLWFNGSDRIVATSRGSCNDPSGFGYSFHLTSATASGAPHNTGIDRIRIKPSAGTETGVVVVENLRLS